MDCFCFTVNFVDFLVIVIFIAEDIFISGIISVTDHGHSHGGGGSKAHGHSHGGAKDGDHGHSHLQHGHSHLSQFASINNDDAYPENEKVHEFLTNSGFHLLTVHFSSIFDIVS